MSQLCLLDFNIVVVLYLLGSHGVDLFDCVGSMEDLQSRDGYHDAWWAWLHNSMGVLVDFDSSFDDGWLLSCVILGGDVRSWCHDIFYDYIIRILEMFLFVSLCFLVSIILLELHEFFGLNLKLAWIDW